MSSSNPFVTYWDEDTGFSLRSYQVTELSMELVNLLVYFLIGQGQYSVRMSSEVLPCLLLYCQIF